MLILKVLVYVYYIPNMQFFLVLFLHSRFYEYSASLLDAKDAGRECLIVLSSPFEETLNYCNIIVELVIISGAYRLV